ncbi:MAG TPA: lasso peptide biosynthesis B2 protein [Flavisolibacter sp.]|nr:lasso peptide biosynthesis B2 protein [Flavisolibacter sp.]
MTFRKLKRFLQTPFSQKLLIGEAVMLLAFSKVCILFFPLKKIIPYLGNLNCQLTDLPTTNLAIIATNIRNAILSASSNVPWRSVCLDQALCCMLMLRRRKVSHSLCLGLKKDDMHQQLLAHAWIQLGEEILIGGECSRSFILIANFSTSYLKRA